MKITSVTFRTNRPTVGSKYIHQHVELSARLTKGETPAQAVEKLKAQARELLYPELVNLRTRVAKVAPTVARYLSEVTDEELAELYSEHAEAFSDLLKGNTAPSVFLDDIK